MVDQLEKVDLGKERVVPWWERSKTYRDMWHGSIFDRMILNGEDEEGEDGDTQAGSDGGLVKWEGPRLSRGPDTDAAFGYKGKDKPFHGYKAHLAVDADSQMVVSVVTTPGNEHDGEVLEEVLDRRARAVVADKIYDQKENHELLAQAEIEDRIIRQERRAAEGGSDRRNNNERAVVERANSWLKRWCGGGRARYCPPRRMAKVSIQMILAAMALNLKRWICLQAAGMG